VQTDSKRDVEEAENMEDLEWSRPSRSSWPFRVDPDRRPETVAERSLLILQLLTAVSHLDNYASGLVFRDMIQLIWSARSTLEYRAWGRCGTFSLSATSSSCNLEVRTWLRVQ